MGLLEVVTGSIGDTLTRLGGLRITRLRLLAVDGDTTLEVERAEGWPEPGRVRMDGAVYTYQSIRHDLTQPALLGVAKSVGGVAIAGVLGDHVPGSAVSDASGTFSDLDALRNGFYVETATGEDLIAIGRYLGVPKSQAIASDDKYREIIQAIAYSPRGTMYGLELALDAILGPGQYTISTDPDKSPGKVTVGTDYGNGIGGQTSGPAYLGRTYLAGPEVVTPNADGTLTVPSPVLGYSTLRPKPESSAFDGTRQLLTLASDQEGKTFWANGGNGQVFKASLGPNSIATAIPLFAGSLVSARPLRLAGAATLRLGAYLRAVGVAQLSATDGRQAAIAVANGTVKAVAGMVNSTGGAALGLLTPAGAITGPTYLMPEGAWAQVSVSVGVSRVRLTVNGALISELPTSAFAASATPSVGLGNLSGSNTSSSATMQIRFLDVSGRCQRDYAASGGSSAQALPSGSLVLAGFPLGNDDVGKRLVLTGGQATNPKGGTNNGTFRVVGVTATTATLEGLQATAAISRGQGRNIVTLGSRALMFPQDLGKQIRVDTSVAGNSGTYTITDILDRGTGISLSGLSTPLVQASTTCVVDGLAMAPETGVGCTILPAFVAESGLSWQLSGGLTVTDNGDGTATLTSKQALPLGQVPYEAVIHRVRGGHVQPASGLTTLRTSQVPVLFNQYPFWVAGPFAVLDDYLGTILPSTSHVELQTQ